MSLETLTPLTRMLKTLRPVWEVLDIMELETVVSEILRACFETDAGDTCASDKCASDCLVCDSGVTDTWAGDRGT